MPHDPAAFGFGKAGEAVPEVDPKDLKYVWQWRRDNPGKQLGYGAVLAGEFEMRKNSWSVAYRAAMLALMPQFAPDTLASFTKDGQLDECVFYAAAKVRMEWLGEKPRKGLPFDVQEFVRLANQSLHYRKKFL